MLRRVALIRTDVSEELSASIILVTPMMEAPISFETSVLTRPTRRNIREDAIHHSWECLEKEALPVYRFSLFEREAGLTVGKMRV
jgi:hypothetical protein